MKLRSSYSRFLFVFCLMQFASGRDGDRILSIQSKVEQLIEKRKSLLQRHCQCRGGNRKKRRTCKYEKISFTKCKLNEGNDDVIRKQKRRREKIKIWRKKQKHCTNEKFDGGKGRRRANKKVLQTVHDFYVNLKTDEKCIPEVIPDKIIEILKSSIDCVDNAEKQFQNSQISVHQHQRSFFRCFKEAKEEVRVVMESIDLSKNHCPENMTEKTYEINVTTSYTKRFSINIKNGLEVTKKIIEANAANRPLCDHHRSDEDEDEYDYYDTVKPKNGSKDDDPTQLSYFSEDEGDPENGKPSDYEESSYYDNKDHAKESQSSKPVRRTTADNEKPQTRQKQTKSEKKITQTESSALLLRMPFNMKF